MEESNKNQNDLYFNNVNYNDSDVSKKMEQINNANNLGNNNENKKESDKSETTSTYLKLFDSSIKVKEIYRIFEFYEYLVIEPKHGKHHFAIFFFAGFNENAGKYLLLFKAFFEHFSNIFKIKFKVYFPMLDIVTRENYPKTTMIDEHDERQKNIYTWFNYHIDDSNKNHKFKTNQEKENLIKNFILTEAKNLGSEEQLIFIGFSMGGRYLVHILENLKIKTKFNMFFKSPIWYYDKKKGLYQHNHEYKKYFENKMYLIYSKNDKFAILREGFMTYYLVKEEFSFAKIKVDNGYKHIVDYNCLEFLKETLIKEIIIPAISKF